MNIALRLTVSILVVFAGHTVSAGIIFLPGTGVYQDPELASVSVRGSQGQGGTARVRTTGLQGVLEFSAEDFPEGLGAPAYGCARLPFKQRMVFDIDYADGVVVEGHAQGQIEMPDGRVWDDTDIVHGRGACVSYGGKPCGRIVVDLELRGTLFRREDPQRVASLRMEILGSLVVADGAPRWVALSANSRIGGDKKLMNDIAAAIIKMESCGI